MIEYENLAKFNAPFSGEFQNKYREVIESGWYILGKQVKDFEHSFAAYCGSQYCVGVANGMDALTIALRAFDLPAGSEVIVPSNTYIATILPIINCNLKPVLVEPDLKTYNIDPSKIKEALTKKTVAIMVVHLYGKCCEMDSILAICRDHNLRLIEDCAQAHGARYKNKKAGSFGDFGAFSFYPTKNLGALGDGGSLNTDSETLFKQVAMMRNYGSVKKYYSDIVGLNSRLDEMQAAFLSVKLKALDQINEHKRKLAALYNDGLKADFIKPVTQPDHYDVFHIYNVRHSSRDSLKAYLLKNNIRTEIHYPVPPHQQKAMGDIPDIHNRSYPIAEEIHATTLSLPISYFHTEQDILSVIDAMNRF